MLVRKEIVLCSFALSACAGTAERAAWRDVSEARGYRENAATATPSAPAGTPRGSVHSASPGAPPAALGSAAGGAAVKEPSTREAGLDHYRALAMKNSPALRASFERWQASVYSISRTRRLPDPKLSFGYFLSAVETRVGPQIARVSLQQSFPWPTTLTAWADAAAAQARAQQRMFEALALSLEQRVAAAYYKLWLIRESRAIHREHLDVLRSLSETVLARVATGTATLSEQLQVDLSAARLEDMIAGMDEEERVAIAELNAVLGNSGPPDMPTPDGPAETELPVATHAELSRAVRTHPGLASYEQLAVAQEEMARAKSAQRLPSFTIAADWIVTGEARMPDVPDSGKDAVIVGGGISVPLWQSSYGDEEDAARAEASAQRSERQAAEDRALAELESSLAAVRDAARRVGTYRHTLVPQADAAYDSVLGAYVAGRGTVAQTLLAQRDILELHTELARARADHARAWARLESVVGHELAATPRKASASAGESHGQ